MGNIEYFSKIQGGYGIMNYDVMGDILDNIIESASYGILRVGNSTISNWDAIVAGTSGNTYAGSGSLYGSWKYTRNG